MKNKNIYLIIATIILILAIAIGIILFNSLNHELSKNNNQNIPTTIANPAATFCVEQGGKSEIKTNEDGSQSGICVINGQEYNDWEYLGNNQK
jgi:putative hemolysin